MSGPPKCPQCRRGLKPGSGLVVGAWYCDRCRSAFTQAHVDSQQEPEGKIVPGPWR